MAVERVFLASLTWHPVIYHQVDIAASASVIALLMRCVPPLIRWQAVAGAGFTHLQIADRIIIAFFNTPVMIPVSPITIPPYWWKIYSIPSSTLIIVTNRGRVSARVGKLQLQCCFCTGNKPAWQLKRLRALQ